MLRIKICGLTTPQDAVAAIESGADALGFNFFSGSKRFVGTGAAWIGELPSSVDKLAVLVNPTWEQAEMLSQTPGISALQLHGAETPEFCGRLREAGIRFEKALPVSGFESLRNVADYSTSTVLLDSSGPGGFGGSGRTFPWKIARAFIDANPQLRVVLAGGLTPENVGEAVAAARPFGVDVTTGVETAPGFKDHDRLRAFIKAARTA